MFIMFQDKSIIGFCKFPFCGGFSLYISQIEASTSPPSPRPRQPPAHLTFLKIIVQIPPYPNQNTIQMPHNWVHLGDQMPPSRGDLKTFHIIHYVRALKAKPVTVCNRQYSFYSNLFCNS